MRCPNSWRSTQSESWSSQLSERQMVPVLAKSHELLCPICNIISHWRILEWWRKLFVASQWMERLGPVRILLAKGSLRPKNPNSLYSVSHGNLVFRRQTQHRRNRRWGCRRRGRPDYRCGNNLVVLLPPPTQILLI